ncbi:MAG: HAD family hydrolase [Deltaproteobacteria bacterium]|nr:HAD family hydrolase [Deltaproteobacteria bacterium]
MNQITAIGFDLFNTLITVEPQTLIDAIERLIQGLKKSGLHFDDESFKRAYRESAVSFIEEAKQNGLETHNRFWISRALKNQGHDIHPDDPLIESVVGHYFSAFYHRCHLIPDTKNMLRTLKKDYGLGLLSNFTHGPAARIIIDRVGLRPFFDVVLISGEIGYRKPHPLVFSRLLEHLGAAKEQLLYIGDDPEPDIHGASRAGIQPVWTTCVRDQKLPFVPGVIAGDPDQPDFEVPKISSWDELYSLLKET